MLRGRIKKQDCEIREVIFQNRCKARKVMPVENKYTHMFLEHGSLPNEPWYYSWEENLELGVSYPSAVTMYKGIIPK